jgi:DNA-binding XRE family transcriptional regulator
VESAYRRKTTVMIINDILTSQVRFGGIDDFVCLCEAPKMISSAQCRAARGLLDWSQQELADKAQVGVVTVRQLEAGTHRPRRATLEVVRRCLELGGVELIDENGGGAGVRLRKTNSRKHPKG